MSQQALTPLQQYMKTSRELMSPKPITNQQLEERINQLNALVNKPRKMTIYDMATKMSQGLSANARSGRPSSISYGLADGFNSISQSINERKDLSDKISQELRQMAYQDLQRERAKSLEFEQGMAKLIYESQIEKDDDVQLFTGKSKEANAFRILSQGNDASDPKGSIEVRKLPEYRFAYALLSKDEVITFPDGSKKTRPAYDLKALGIKPPLYATGTPSTSQAPKSATTAGAQGKLNLPKGDPEYNVTYTTQQMLAHGAYPNFKSPAGKPVYIKGYKNGQVQFTDTP